MRHRKLHCNRQVDNNLILGSRLPYVYNCVADLESEIRFCTRERLRRIFKADIALMVLTVFSAENSSLNSDVDYLLLVLAKDLLTLSNGR